ncbi:hypothetical protein AXF42_Ash020180 [Apostasia shenzhenica]|uniref:Transmembrane protein n=1 Tax=Apostasia shenzhenica TaxID=1088818 RepID=A0A2H9ZVX9_9ASPA|nr:hypothetical protein AXF42_Ash020180 [Apostasia shenzhenica]
MGGDDLQHSRLFHELCSLVFALLRSPHLFFPSAAPRLPPPPPRPSLPLRLSQLSPAGLASLLLGASLALMLCGSVAFVLGCILMPWIIGFVMVFYFVGVISSLSGLGKVILCSAVPWPEQPSTKEFSDEFFSKLPIE